MITEPVPTLPQDTRSPADHANPRGHLAYSGSNPGPATTSQNNPLASPDTVRGLSCPVRFACGGRRARAGSHGKYARKTAWCLRGRCAVVGLGAGVVPALFSQVVMTCRLAEPARTGRRGEGGSVLMPLHSPEL